jgi:hypothetical protein
MNRPSSTVEKFLFTATSVFFLNMFVNAQSAANVNDIMLQAFGWAVHTKTSVSS